MIAVIATPCVTPTGNANKNPTESEANLPRLSLRSNTSTQIAQYPAAA